MYYVILPAGSRLYSIKHITISVKKYMNVGIFFLSEKYKDYSSV